MNNTTMMSDGGGGGVDLFLNAGALANHSKAVSDAATKYLDAVEEIRAKVTDLTNNGQWSGMDTSSFGAAVLTKIPKMEELGRTIAEYSNNIQQRADELVSTSSNIARSASDL